MLDAAALGELVRRVIAERIGARLAVIVRSPAQLATVLACNPFPPGEAVRTYFTLLAASPGPDRCREWLDLDFAPDDVRLAGDTIYARYATDYSGSRFNKNFFERRLEVAATTRNHNTLSRLVELST